ncbi:hypothetical protein OHA27_34660 [Streptomyces sp. NBC_01619]|uniref:Uncharacterized protein n=1 Tax=Streptomyces pratisoli TaxID=3139917 RepID=A0ACC6QVG4_9ACTN|nr:MULTISPECIES: hypothetical protein [unclassified Streptomyces]MCX4515373.1 hypothetical protein [Streptomyces sp. NBC_01619]
MPADGDLPVRLPFTLRPIRSSGLARALPVVCLPFASLGSRSRTPSRNRAESDDLVATEQRRRAEAVAALPLPGHAVRPRESAGFFDHRLDAAARADIPPDGTWHTVTVGDPGRPALESRP